MKAKLFQINILFLVFVLNACGAVFYNPIISSGADPSCTFWNGNYYYMETDGGLYVRKAPHLVGPSGVGAAPGVSVFTPPAPYNVNVWAPELHYINGNWYIYYTAGTANDPSDISHRLFCIKADTQDPQGTYTMMGEVRDPNHDFWSIDPTVLQKDDGSLFLVWCSRIGSANSGGSRLYIAPMSNPWTLSGARVLISSSTYSWENGINEAPQVIEHNGAINIVYSANCTCGNNYCLGLLLNPDGNVLTPGSWTKNSTPIFQTYVGADGAVYAPGSCAFTKSLDGTEDWIVFHAAKSSGSGFDREVHAQSFSWTPGFNTPNLGHPFPDGDPIAVPSGESVVELTTSRESHLRLQDGRMITFVCAYPDGSVWDQWENTPGGTWSGWNEFGGTGGFKRLDAMQNSDGTLALFGVGDNTSVWINWQNIANGTWAGFQSLGGIFQDCKSFRYPDGRYAVFGMDGNQIWVNAQVAPNSAWGGWGALGGGGFTQVSPLLLPDNTFVAFGVGNMTSIWMDRQTNANSGWTGWQNLGGSFKNVRAFRYNDGRFSVFAGDGNLVWNNTQISSNGAWGGWQSFTGGGITQYDPTKLADEKFSMLSVAGSSIFQNTQTNYGGGWTGWIGLGGGGFTKVDGNQLPDGRMYLFGNGLGTSEWFKYQAISNGAWNPNWTNLGGAIY